MQQKIFILLLSMCLFTGCQIISPIFVDYNGVRRDVAQWINHHSFLSMQQKRSMAQLSRAQQKIVRFADLNTEQQLELARENQIALSCASQRLSQKQIQQLQQQIFGEKTAKVLLSYAQLAPKIKLDATQIQCD
ncbi:hypothetical protein HYG93_09860 [Acinetobacter sp. SwsAc6]|uniref:hypothetical protein n=1 Tax=Acinetobacter TaxID=469 RepID=UPI000D124D59|nr:MULTISPECIES: hypothetical protein [Acinetobacter]NWK74585.1 hypothetical protein [Acinetobacter sp. SwsAc6]QCO21497.1 hypothetical protein C9E88_008240 [Acinetobacter cumulans]RFS27752.1 hypothetical protein DYI81_15295 [Acinetobacter sp. SWAC5]RKG40657.1 hypothetical protein D7V51_15035 [Acinetobacter cumulans]RKG47109.1 hypothetical protein D7V68_12935 [Acinetobacter cumulans]